MISPLLLIMKKSRDAMGRFSNENHGENTRVAIENGFIEELNNFQRLFYSIWRILPILLLILILAKYFNVSEKTTDILVEVLCGTGCKCQCMAKKTSDKDV
jgi:hypothetical protein